MKLIIVGGSADHIGGIEAFCDRAKSALENGGRHHIERIWSGTAYLTVKRLPMVLKGLFRLARSRPVDCVWVQYGNLPDLAFLILAKILRRKVLVTPHLGLNWRSQANPFLRTLSCKLLGFANRLALISKTQEEELLLPDHVPRSYIRNFLPKRIWTTELPESRTSTGDGLQLVHAGRLSEGKGTFLLIEVCDKLRTSNIPFTARIAGAADEETLARMQDMIGQRGLGSHISVLGRVSDEELLNLLQSSDVLMHLSKIDSYPLIVLESIAYCVFPICIDLAGASDMISSYTGYAVSTATAVQQAADFLRLQNPEELWSLSREAASHLRIDYSWEVCVKSLEMALTATVAGS
jgi:glycosyltransferase involved in cell wall biosynthesis